jgi:oligopeptide transport system substrate-binding protein
MKKIAIFIVIAMLLSLFAGCQAKEVTVTFDTQGGSAVSSVTLGKGVPVSEPADPTKGDVDGKASSFVNWTTDMAGNNPYDFSMAVEEDMTLYAQWTLNVVLNFDTRTDATVDRVLLGENGGDAAEPTAPTRDGYRFGGWYTTKRGLTWLTPDPVEFPYNVTTSTTLYAYWEPIDSKAVDYGPEVTYTSTLDDSSLLILNPLIYEWSHEDALIDSMVTLLYSDSSDNAVVDWEKAIADGIADFPGDFSKIIAKEFSIEALDYIIELRGAVNYPIDSEGEEHLTEDGKYDREAAVAIKDTEWTFNIRNDLKFEDGTPITAADYEYSLKQYLDPVLNNYRATIMYKNDDNQNGAPILNAAEYFTSTPGVDWDDVGFEVLGDYSFKMTFWEPVSQSAAIGHANSIRLIHKEAFEASLTSTKEDAAYGTPDYPYVSYGAYIIKTWDENQKVVFNKNYDYIGKGSVNYKCRAIEIVDSVDTRMSLFAAGEVSVAGLTQDYYAEYAEYPNLLRSWDGYPQYMIVNLGNSKITEDPLVHDDILFDKRFRQALFYGFDRNYYASNVYAPNTASLMPIPLDTKAYNQDVFYYSESPQHLALLEKLNINPESAGYIPDKAVQLFDEAYAAWKAAGNSGVATIKLISDNDDFSKNLVEHVKASYEALFNKEGEAKRFELEIIYNEKTAHRAKQAAWDFDLALSSIGFGTSTGAQWQYPAIAFFGDLIGGGGLGLSQPHDASMGTDAEGNEIFGAYSDQIIEVDLTTTWNYLEELGMDAMEEDELEGHIELYGYLKADGDKPAGIYKGSVYDISMVVINLDVPWDGVASEPFPGAASDIHNYLAALEEVFFEHVTMIPTVTRSSATVYAENVVITWPAYSSAFGWGSGRYRYLNTDPDFMD